MVTVSWMSESFIRCPLVFLNSLWHTQLKFLLMLKSTGEEYPQTDPRISFDKLLAKSEYVLYSEQRSCGLRNSEPSPFAFQKYSKDPPSPSGLNADKLTGLKSGPLSSQGVLTGRGESESEWILYGDPGLSGVGFLTLAGRVLWSNLWGFIAVVEHPLDTNVQPELSTRFSVWPGRGCSLRTLMLESKDWSRSSNWSKLSKNSLTSESESSTPSFKTGILGMLSFALRLFWYPTSSRNIIGLGLEQSDSSDSVRDVEVAHLFGSLLSAYKLSEIAGHVVDFKTVSDTFAAVFSLHTDFLGIELIIMRDPDKSLKWKGTVWDATSLWFLWLWPPAKSENSS